MRLSKRVVFFLLLGSILVGGCSRDLSPQKYMQYYEKHQKDFTSTITRQGIKASVCYSPVEYYAARDMVSDQGLTTAKALQRYGNSVFFVFTIESQENPNQSVLLDRDKMAGFQDNVFKNTFDRNKDIFLINYNKNDTVALTDYQYERNWGMGTGDTFVLGFQKDLLKYPLATYHLIIREMAVEMGTVDFALSKVVRKVKKLKG